MTDTYTEQLRSLTFAVLHNPNCPMPFQVRLIADGAWRLDFQADPETKDICGYGHSLEDAAKEAWNKRFGKK